MLNVFNSICIYHKQFKKAKKNVLCFNEKKIMMNYVLENNCAFLSYFFRVNY